MDVGWLIERMRKRKCKLGVERVGVGIDGETYQSAGGVDACVTDCGVVEPFWLGEAEESVV